MPAQRSALEVAPPPTHLATLRFALLHFARSSAAPATAAAASAACSLWHSTHRHRPWSLVLPAPDVEARSEGAGQLLPVCQQLCLLPFVLPEMLSCCDLASQLWAWQLCCGWQSLGSAVDAGPDQRRRLLRARSVAACLPWRPAGEPRQALADSRRAAWGSCVSTASH